MGRLFTASIEEGARPMGGGLPKSRHKAKAVGQQSAKVASALQSTSTPLTAAQEAPPETAPAVSSCVKQRSRLSASAGGCVEARQLRCSQRTRYRCFAINARQATFGRSKLRTSRNLDCKSFEEEHPPISAKDLAERAMQKAHENGEQVESMIQEYEADARVQAKVLSSLGIRSDSVLGQRVLVPEDIPQLLGIECETIARKIFRKNSFEKSIKPAARALSKSGMWPLIMSRRKQGHITEVPTLELCAAVCTRILSVARRLRSKGNRNLVFLGVGSGDALVEASIALHLGHVLGQQVVLSRSPLTFTYEGDFKILFLASDTPNPVKRIENRSSEVIAQMAVQQYDVKEAVTDFANEGVPLYVFASWPPEKVNWLELIQGASGHVLKELCFLQPPPCLRQLETSEYESKELRTTQLFPKTLCRQDYLSHGFSDGPEVTFHHSQLYLWTPKEVPRPYLASQLEHAWGSFEQRMKANPALEGLHYFHRVGLSHARSPEDLSVGLPDKILEGMKNLLYHEMQGIEVADLRKWLREALRFAEGGAKKQLDLLVKNSAYRMYQSDKTGKDFVASMDPALGKLLGVNSKQHEQQRSIQSGSGGSAMPNITYNAPPSAKSNSTVAAPRGDANAVAAAPNVKGLEAFRKLYGMRS